MSTTGQSGDAADAVADVATDLASAGFVRVLARATGDALAAAGVLGRALSTVDTPYQVAVAPTAADRRRRTAGPTADGSDPTTVLIGPTPGTEATVLPATGRPASVVAARVVDEMGVVPDATLARAGAVAAGAGPATVTVPGASALERRPGVAVPTTDLAEGLAQTTLVHAGFSGDTSAAAELLARLDVADDPDDEARRRLASAVAISATDAGAGTAPVERVLRPAVTPSAPVETLGGFADVLSATAAVAPGVGVATALGHDVRSAALSAWREHGRAVHATLRDARTSRYDGVFVTQAAGSPPVRATATLSLATRSPEPTALVLGDGEAAVAATADVDVGDAVRAAASAVGAAADATPSDGYLSFDDGVDVKGLVAAFREAL